jgi:hypothetical protein
LNQRILGLIGAGVFLFLISHASFAQLFQHENPQRSPKEEPGWVQEIRQYGERPSHNHLAIWTMTHQLMNRLAVREFLRREFTEFLSAQEEFPEGMVAQDPEAQGFRIYEFPDHVLYILIRENPDLWPEIENHLNEEVPVLDQFERKITQEHIRISEIFKSRFGIQDFGREVLNEEDLSFLETEALKRALVHLSSSIRLRREFSVIHTALDRVIIEDQKVAETIRGRRRIGPKTREQLSVIMQQLQVHSNELALLSKKIGQVFHKMIDERLYEGREPKDRKYRFFDPRAPLYVTTQSGEPSIKKIETLATDPVLLHDRTVPKGNLQQAILDLIGQAEKGDTLVFSFFDLNLPDVAEAIFQAHDRGAIVYGAVDKNIF